MFGRGRSKGEPRHPDLTALSVAQSDALHELFLAALTARGEQGRTTGDGVIRTDTMTYGLHNLSLQVAQAPRRDWPAMVDEHVALMTANEDDADAPVTDDMLLLKLRAATDVDSDPLFADASPFPGLLVLPAVDFPTYVRELLSQDRLTRFGGWERVRELGATNLRRLPLPLVHRLDTADGDASGYVYTLVTDDFFGASRVLVLDDLLASAIGVERPSHGCLVAMPNRHLLAVQPVSGPGVVTALDTLVRLADGEFHDQPGPISREVFYLPPGGGVAQQLSRHDPDGGPTDVVVDGEFEEALIALGLLGG